MLNIGDRVLCINDSIKPEALEETLRDVPNFVKKGSKYTIRGFNENAGIVVGVLLQEIRNPILHFKLLGHSQESAFATFRFEKMKENEVLVQEEVEEFVN
jgi:hypothetical protein